MDKSYKQFKAEIEAGKVRPAYLLLGENIYLKDEFIKAMEKKFISPDFASTNKLIVYSSNSADVDIRGWLHTVPFGSGKKLLVFVIENKKLVAESVKKQMQKWIDKPSKAGILIILSGEKKLGAQYIKPLQNAASCICWNFWPSEVRIRIKAFMKNRGMNIEEGAIGFLQEIFEVDMYAITTELEKLISFISPGKVLREADVRRMGEQELTGSIYHLTHAIGNKDFVKATKALDLLFELKEHPGKILWNIHRHLDILFKLKEHPNESFGIGKMHLPEYRKESKNWEQGDIPKAFSLLYEADYGIKSGKAKPKFLFEEMMYKFKHLK